MQTQKSTNELQLVDFYKLTVSVLVFITWKTNYLHDCSSSKNTSFECEIFIDRSYKERY